MEIPISSQSEVQRTLAAIVSEYEASQRGLCGLAAVARHAAIATHQQRIGKRFHELASMVGDEKHAMALFVASLEQSEKKVLPQDEATIARHND